MTCHDSGGLASAACTPSQPLNARRFALSRIVPRPSQATIARARLFGVNEIPPHTAHLAERLLRRYCDRICPPTARHIVQLDFDLAPDRVTLFEMRLFCGVPGATRRVPFAQMRYRTTPPAWTLHYHQADGHWRRYRHLPPAASLVSLLRAVDADAHNLFWPHINGASLRWCDPRGRCSECDERYCTILGLSLPIAVRAVGGP